MTNTVISSSQYATRIACFPALLAFVNISLLNVQAGYTSRSKMPNVASGANIVSRTLSMFNLNIRSQLNAIEAVQIGDNLYNLSSNVSTKSSSRRVSFDKLSFVSDIEYVFSSQANLSFPLIPLTPMQGKDIINYLNNAYTNNPSFTGIYSHYRLVDRAYSAMENGELFTYAPTHEQIEQLHRAHFDMHKDSGPLLNNLGIIDFSQSISEEDCATLINDYGNLVSGSVNSAFSISHYAARCNTYDAFADYIRRHHSIDASDAYIRFLNLSCSDDILACISKFLLTGETDVANIGTLSDVINALAEITGMHNHKKKAVLIFSLVSASSNFAFIVSNRKLNSFADIPLVFIAKYTASISKNAFLNKDLLASTMNAIATHPINTILTIDAIANEE